MNVKQNVWFQTFESQAGSVVASLMTISNYGNVISSIIVNATENAEYTCNAIGYYGSNTSAVVKLGTFGKHTILACSSFIQPAQ